ncbi:MAG: hypothetical protein Q4D90_11420 [bacterium]|nr:hypothetical protein [bacterium]
MKEELRKLAGMCVMKDMREKLDELARHNVKRTWTDEELINMLIENIKADEHLLNTGARMCKKMDAVDNSISMVDYRIFDDDSTRVDIIYYVGCHDVICLLYAIDTHAEAIVHYDMFNLMEPVKGRLLDTRWS